MKSPNADDSTRPNTDYEGKPGKVSSSIGDMSGRLQQLSEGVSPSTWSLVKCTVVFFFGVVLINKMQKVVSEMM